MINGIVFFEDYFNYMDDLTPEEYCDFMRMIRDLRFKGVDIKPEEIENKNVRLVWRAVRPSILKSMRNAKDYERKKNKGQEQEPQVSTYTTPPQVTAVFYPPVPEDEARDFPTQQDREEWFATLLPDASPSRKDKFNNEWFNYFPSRMEAKSRAEDYLSNYKIHVSF